jgi:hypothetical protein
MELLCDVCEVKAHFCSFALLLSAQGRCTICAKYTTAWKSFWAHLMDLLGDVGKIEAHFGLFGDSVNLDAR